MTAFISPRIAVDFQFEGVTFSLLPLTAEQALPIQVGLRLVGGDDERQVRAIGAALTHAVRCSLRGWSGGGAPAWDANDPQANLDRLSHAAYLAIADKILAISGLSSDEKKTF